MDNKTLLAEMHKIRKEIGDQMESVALRCIKAFNEVETRISKLEADIRDAKKPNKR
jgi:BMFP domain-containing protein YqiC